MSDPVPQHFWDRALPDMADEAVGFTGLVLASRSPQRKLLLEQLRMPFRIVVSEHVEGVSDGAPAHTVQQNARGKAEEMDVMIAKAGDQRAAATIKFLPVRR